MTISKKITEKVFQYSSLILALSYMVYDNDVLCNTLVSIVIVLMAASFYSTVKNGIKEAKNGLPSSPAPSTLIEIIDEFFIYGAGAFIVYFSGGERTLGLWFVLLFFALLDLIYFLCHRRRTPSSKK